MALVIYKDDLSPSLSGSVLVGGAPFDLTGSTVKLQMRDIGATTLKVDAAATIGTATTTVNGAQVVPRSTLVVASTTGFLPSGWISVGGLLLSYRALSATAFLDVAGGDGTLADAAAISQIGGVSYNWVAADVNTAGDYIAWWLVTLAGGKTQKSDPFAVDVRDVLGSSAYLCDLHDVRLALEAAAREVARDTRIERAIASASAAITDYTSREWAPAVTATARRFIVYPHRRLRQPNHVNPYLVSLAPYDLRTVTAAKLHEGTTDEVTLAAGDYSLRPYQGVDGAYTDIALKPSVTLAGDLGANFGVYELHILGDWGHASIPTAVRDAAVLTAMSYLDKPISEYAGEITVEDIREVSPTVGTSLWIPAAARRLLNRYMRMPEF